MSSVEETPAEELSPEELAERAADARYEELQGIIRRRDKALAKERDRTEVIRKAIHQAIEDGIAGLEFADLRPPKRDRRGAQDEEWAIAVLSDWQLGKRTPTYDSEVTEERVSLYAKKVSQIVEIQRLDHPVRRLAVFLVGDMIEGELIFPGQAHEIDSSLYRQVTIDGPRILGGFIRWAAEEFEEVHIYAVPGNHGYLAGRARREMMKESNGDRMLYQIVSQLTEDIENVSWTIAEDWWLVADLGAELRFLLLHGDQVRGYNGIPWYGWQRKITAWGSLARIWTEMDFDHAVAGHFHTPVSLYLNGRRLWINASTESHNPYALEQLAAAGEPAQWLLFAREGRYVTAEYLVNLSD